MARLWTTLKQIAGRDDIPYPSSNPLTRAKTKKLKEGRANDKRNRLKLK